MTSMEYEEWEAEMAEAELLRAHERGSPEGLKQPHSLLKQKIAQDLCTDCAHRGYLRGSHEGDIACFRVDEDGQARPCEAYLKRR